MERVGGAVWPDVIGLDSTSSYMAHYNLILTIEYDRFADNDIPCYVSRPTVI